MLPVLTLDGPTDTHSVSSATTNTLVEGDWLSLRMIPAYSGWPAGSYLQS